MNDTAVTEKMVEAGAAAMHSHGDEGKWADATNKDFWRNYAEECLTAALSAPVPLVERHPRDSNLVECQKEGELGDKGDGWQPIDTAPKDGTDILLADCRVRGGFLTVASYELVDGSEWVWHTNDGPSYHTEAFTHWRPLPAAPSPASIEGETKP